MTDAPRRQRLLLALLGTTMFFAGGSMFVARTAADALFLRAFDKSALAYIYISAPVAVGTGGFVFSLFAHRVALSRILLLTLSIASAVFGMLGSWTSIAQSRPGLIGLYNFTELYAVLITVELMTFVGQIFSPRDAKR